MLMNTHPVRFGIQTGQQGVEWATMLELWQNVEKWGYDSLWNFDHFYAIFVDPATPCLEGWTTLSALAQATTKIRIGHLVNGNTYRHPCITAKMAVSLDHISGGRLNLGIGAGWFELEHRSFGLDFKTVRGRLEALEESLQIIKGMVGGERVSIEGKHYTVSEAFCNPQALQDGGPPIMIGGHGRKILLRIVAQYADMWNANLDPPAMGELIEVMRAHGDAVGRDVDEIEKTVMLPLVYTADTEKQTFMCELLSGLAEDVSPQQMRERMMIGETQECLDKIEAYVAAGVTHFIFMTFAPYNSEEIQAFAENVIPALRASA